MRKKAWFGIMLVAFLALAGVVAGERPQLGPFTTTGYTAGYQLVELPTGGAKFHLIALGSEGEEDDWICEQFELPGCGAGGYFEGGFMFEEWGVFDPSFTHGVNYGLLTVYTPEGTADFRFDGEASLVSGYVTGSFVLLDGTVGYEHLKGQGQFMGNAGPVFTVYYTPCGKHTGSECLASPCLVRGSDLGFSRKTVEWQLTNYGEDEITIESITIVWPEGNGKLKNITHNDDVYDYHLDPPWATIDGAWPDDDGLEIEAGETEQLEFGFQRQVSTEPSDYTIVVKFEEGCATAAVAFPE